MTARRHSAPLQLVKDAPSADGIGSTGDRLLTVREVADLLRLTPEAIYKLSRLGRLQSLAFDTGGRRPVRRWLQRDVMQFIEMAKAPWSPRGRR